MTWRTRVALGSMLMVAGLAALAWAFVYGGGAEPGLLDQAGPVVRWGLPVAKLVFQLAAAGTIGSLVLAVFALSSAEPGWTKALRLAGITAAVWTGAAAVFSVFNFHNVANKPLSAEGFGPGFATFLLTDAGRPGAVSVLITASVSVLCFTARRRPVVIVTTLLAFAGLVPLILTSHATGGDDHVDSTTALVLHIGAAAVWLGGLATLTMLRPVLPAGRLVVMAQRFSSLALASYIVLGVSGFLAARAALGSLDNLATPYGVILLAKAAIFILGGTFGTIQRGWALERLERAPDRGARPYLAFLVSELAFLGAASGLAAALARTQAPIAIADAPDRPPVPGLWSYLSQWEPDSLWLLVCAFGVFLYLAGVRRIQVAGGGWPMRRTLFWVAGMGVLFMVTSGGIHVYQRFLFNSNVLTQMLLTAVVPLLLVPAAPITLAERTIANRTDGSTGVREMISSTVRPVLAWARASRYVPVLAIAVSLYIVYYTPLLRFSALNQLGYSAMSVLALLSGLLFTAAMLGPAEGDLRQTRSSRLLILAVTAGVYALYGWGLSAQALTLEEPWYLEVGQPWGVTGGAAVGLGGPFMWAIAAATLAVTALLVTVRGTPGHQRPDLAGEPVPQSVPTAP